MNRIYYTKNIGQIRQFVRNTIFWRKLQTNLERGRNIGKYCVLITGEKESVQIMNTTVSQHRNKTKHMQNHIKSHPETR